MLQITKIQFNFKVPDKHRINYEILFCIHPEVENTKQYQFYVNNIWKESNFQCLCRIHLTLLILEHEWRELRVSEVDPLLLEDIFTSLDYQRKSEFIIVIMICKSVLLIIASITLIN